MKTKAIALFLLGFIPAFAQDIPTSKTEPKYAESNAVKRITPSYSEARH